MMPFFDGGEITASAQWRRHAAATSCSLTARWMFLLIEPFKKGIREHRAASTSGPRIQHSIVLSSL